MRRKGRWRMQNAELEKRLGFPIWRAMEMNDGSLSNIKLSS